MKFLPADLPRYHIYFNRMKYSSHGWDRRTTSPWYYVQIKHLKAFLGKIRFENATIKSYNEIQEVSKGRRPNVTTTIMYMTDTRTIEGCNRLIKSVTVQRRRKAFGGLLRIYKTSRLKTYFTSSENIFLKHDGKTLNRIGHYIDRAVAARLQELQLSQKSWQKKKTISNVSLWA